MRGLLMTLLVLLCCAGMSMAAERSELQVAIISFPGYSYLDETGQPAGKTVTLSRKLLTEAGYNAQFKILPAARVWQGLKSGEVDVWLGLLNKPDLHEHVLLTKRDLGQIGINLYHRPDTPSPVWPEGMRGKNIITITNFTYTGPLKQVLIDPAMDLKMYQSGSHAGALAMLMRGRGDYLLDYRSQVDPLLRQQGVAALPYIEVALQPLRFVLSRRTPGVQQLREDLDAAFDRLHAAGEELDVTRQ